MKRAFLRTGILCVAMLSLPLALNLAPSTRGQDSTEVSRRPRFQVPEGFLVEEVYVPEKSGSVIAMTFDSRGRLVFSQERGPVLTLLNHEARRQGKKVKRFTDKVINCQGLFFDGDDLLAVGDGPEGTALYRVVDKNGDGKGDQVLTLARFTQKMGEHGPHAVLFGPDGWLYVILGNHTGMVPTPDLYSPLRDYYEGQLVKRYTDPRGHAVNIRAPGGTVFRVDPSGHRWQLVAGGFRNAYDADFNLLGELFTLDSDMEWDINLPWYRPVRTNHVVPGGDYGWRTGSGKWPEYYPDSLPALTNIGRGSPVGVEFYQHYVYPARYYDSFLQGDWSRGRILAGFHSRAGATYRETLEDFVLGEPLNITDLEVGPDGFLYFSKGGRSTEGGLYRVVYTSAQPPQKPYSLLEEALTQPQPRSAWGRANLARIRREMGEQWGKALLEEVEDRKSSPERRIRALELLQVYGPVPSEELLVSLGQDRHWDVRAASTYYLGLQRTDSSRRELGRRLHDRDPFVRRRSCEALIRTEIHPGMSVPFSPVHDLFPLLKDPDRWVRYAARQVLRRVNRNLWRDEAFKLEHFPEATEGLLALVQTSQGSNDIPFLLERQLELLKDRPADEELIGLLRAVHLTMIQDQGVDYSKIYRRMGELLLQRFPSAHQDLNRELALTFAHLQTAGAVEKILAQLQDPALSREQQIHYAYCLRLMRQEWGEPQREDFIRWFEKTQEERWKGGASFLGFLENMWNDFLDYLPAEEKQLAREQVPWLSPELLASTDQLQLTPRRGPENKALSEQELSEYLLWDPMSYTGDPERGQPAFEKAYCANCHIHGDIGQEAGPDLTDVGKRFQRKDLIEAILYPSKTISDLWTAVEVITTDDEAIVGVVSREDGESVTLIIGTGGRLALPRARIKSRRASKTSLMPEGLLDMLSLRETVDLFAFLEKGAVHKRVRD